MKLSIESVHMGAVVVLVHERFEDSAGFSWRPSVLTSLRTWFADGFVQDKLPSSKHVLRGLHFQWSPPMGKLMRVAQGRAFLVAADICKDSPTLGQSFEWKSRPKMEAAVDLPDSRAASRAVRHREIQYKCRYHKPPGGERHSLERSGPRNHLAGVDDPFDQGRACAHIGRLARVGGLESFPRVFLGHQPSAKGVRTAHENLDSGRRRLRGLRPYTEAPRAGLRR
jgi:dTDP-4-dehydrorhamnose 3,5-epimerase-like enzyme